MNSMPVKHYPLQYDHFNEEFLGNFERVIGKNLRNIKFLLLICNFDNKFDMRFLVNTSNSIMTKLN